MKLEKIGIGIGLTLLAACYALSLWHAFHADDGTLVGDKTTIRIAHWQLERGVRTSFDRLIEEYEKIHPEIRVEQLAIPESVYSFWLVTELTGGTAPDLIEIGGNIPDERVARYFRPLTDEVAQPNPYNAGTSLEKTPWRDTFLDGLLNRPMYNDALLDFYGVTLGINTVRLYYNKALYEAALGAGAPPPATYADLVAACRKIEAYGQRNGRPLIPIAGSSYNGPVIMGQLAGSQNQRLGLKLDHTLDMNYDLRTATLLGYLDGRWSLKDPAITSGLHLMQEVSRFMQPGFMQVAREDATFAFLQQRAVMISTGSWDVITLTAQASFPIGICRIPIPSRDDPRYGAYVLGPVSEAATATGLPLGLTRASAHPEAAIDFLRFVTSHRGDTIFSDTSHWLPSIEGVPVPAPVRDFTPVVEGYTPGFGVAPAADTGRLFNNNFYLLTGEGDAAPAFLQSLQDDGYRDAVATDLQRDVKVRYQNIQRADSTLGALLEIARRSPDDPTASRKLQDIGEQQNENEILNYRVARSLSRAGFAQP